MPAQKSAHDMPPGIGVEAQFFSWQSQYFWHAGELAVESPAAPALALPAAEAPALELPELPALELPALPFAAPPVPPPESVDPQPTAIAHEHMEAMSNGDRM
jgi:hypothetical protein